MIDVLKFVAVAFVSMGGAFVQRTSGFGFGIFVMLFFPYLMPSHASAAAVSSFLSCGTSTYNAVTNRKHLRLKLVFPMLISAALVIPFAVYFSAYASARVMKIMLGCVLILFSLYFLFLGGKVRLRPTMVNGLISGTLGGALSGLFSTGGPPAVLYLVHATEDKQIYFATIQTYFLLTNLYSTVFRVINGVIDRNVIFFALVGAVGAILGNFLGSAVFRRLNERKLKLVIYIGMIISGILMLF
ncbi:MAG: sulfite exporter TauE/SafE family protein [Clostridia bacterium]|nr:sulfite exporter TauE/SafE family protein [Clostridia bacterium]